MATVSSSTSVPVVLHLYPSSSNIDQNKTHTYEIVAKAIIPPFADFQSTINAVKQQKQPGLLERVVHCYDTSLPCNWTVNVQSLKNTIELFFMDYIQELEYIKSSSSSLPIILQMYPICSKPEQKIKTVHIVIRIIIPIFANIEATLNSLREANPEDKIVYHYDTRQTKAAQAIETASAIAKFAYTFYDKYFITTSSEVYNHTRIPPEPKSISASHSSSTPSVTKQLPSSGNTTKAGLTSQSYNGTSLVNPYESEEALADQVLAAAALKNRTSTGSAPVFVSASAPPITRSQALTEEFQRMSTGSNSTVISTNGTAIIEDEDRSLAQ